MDYNDIVSSDLELMHMIHEWLDRHPQIKLILSQTVSKHPWKDICSSIWIFSCVGLYFIGLCHFYVVSMNLAVVTVMNKVFAVKRPAEYDDSLQPITDLSFERFGFPSIESYMSVVILGHFCIFYPSMISFTFSIVVTFAIGISRVYSKSRFPHQIVGSWVVGLLGLILASNIYTSIGFERMRTTANGAIISAYIVCFLCYFAFTIENNDSRILYTKKSEFRRVVLHILSSSSESTTPDLDETNVQNDDDNSITIRTTSDQASTARMNSPRSRKLENLSQRRKYIKHDSFYYLQRNLEIRSKNQQTDGFLYWDSPRVPANDARI